MLQSLRFLTLIRNFYLSAILDLYDRYPIAFVISGRNDNRLVFKTFDKAIEKKSHSEAYISQR